MPPEREPDLPPSERNWSPNVSVLLPAYNAADTVAAAAESVLTGNNVALELILIDDGSADATRQVIEEVGRADSRVRVISHENIGLAASLNRGIAASRAPLIARMDADDVSAPGRLDLQVKFLSARPDVVAVGGQIRRVVRGVPTSISNLPLEHSQIVNAFLHGHHAICHASAMFRKSALDAIGGYWDDGVSEDWDLFLRLSEIGGLANLAEHLYDVNFGDTGINASNLETVRMNIGFAIFNYHRRAQGFPEIDRIAYVDSLRIWERAKLRAQSRSQKMYRRSMVVTASSRTRGRALLIAAALQWPPFATQRVTRLWSRRLGTPRTSHAR